MNTYSKIVGSGSHLPGELVSNNELAERLAKQGVETSHEWIVERTGITQRYIANKQDKVSDIATLAAKNALDDAGVDVSEVDFIIVATSTPDNTFPSTACVVQANLGVTQGGALDVSAACSGFAYALSLVDGLIQTGKVRCALVIGAEIYSRILDWSDRKTCVLFGDGAGAMVVKASAEPGILATKLYADGRQRHVLSIAGHFGDGQVQGDPYLRMDGQAVYKLAVTHLESSAREVLAMANMTTEQLDWLVPHQANIRILELTAKRLGLKPSQLVVTVNQHANTSAASVPLAYDFARRHGHIKNGQTVLLQGIGGGFTWGAVLARV